MGAAAVNEWRGMDGNQKTARKRIGFVATRLAGMDGVSLETVKWVDILGALNYDCFYFAGELEWPDEYSYHVPEAHFHHPDILRLQADLFDDYVRSPETSDTIQKIKAHIKQHLYRFHRRFQPDLLIVENALSIPMNVPLGLAITEFIAETNLPTIAHHHDFTWERERFAVSAANDYLRAAFPPTLPSVYHVVINSFAARQLALRAGVSSVLIPNVMDFETPPSPPDAVTGQLRAALNIAADESLLLQPTRIVPRKRIELAINLARRLGRKCALLISHAAGDEGRAYADFLRDYSEAMGVRTLFAADHFNHVRQTDSNGKTIFSLADVYQQANLVTYPSRVEGFGNAFVETIYYRRPLVMSSYEIFRTDIQPKGFRVVAFEDFITDDTVRQAARLLDDAAHAAEIVTHNYAIAQKHYSFHALERHLSPLISTALGVI